jgi:hypothetical protein
LQESIVDVEPDDSRGILSVQDAAIELNRVCIDREAPPCTIETRLKTFISIDRFFVQARGNIADKVQLTRDLENAGFDQHADLLRAFVRAAKSSKHDRAVIRKSLRGECWRSHCRAMAHPGLDCAFPVTRNMFWAAQILCMMLCRGDVSKTKLAAAATLCHDEITAQTPRKPDTFSPGLVNFEVLATVNQLTSVYMDVSDDAASDDESFVKWKKTSNQILESYIGLASWLYDRDLLAILNQRSLTSDAKVLGQAVSLNTNRVKQLQQASHLLGSSSSDLLANLFHLPVGNVDAIITWLTHTDFGPSTWLFISSRFSQLLAFSYKRKEHGSMSEREKMTAIQADRLEIRSCA